MKGRKGLSAKTKGVEGAKDKKEITISELTMRERVKLAQSERPSAGYEESVFSHKPKLISPPETRTNGNRPGPRKKALAPQAEYRKSQVNVDNYDLPLHYNVSTLTLMVRDPHWIFAYWELAPPVIEKVRVEAGAEFERSAYVLRMYDVTCIDFNGSNAIRWFDLEVGPFANNWYINLWQDSVSYCAEIGIRTLYGRFFPFARSNFVTTPRLSLSPRRDQIWLEVKDNAVNTPFVMTRPQKLNSSKTNQSSYRNNPGPKENGKRFFLNEDDIRQYYSRLSPLLRDIISKRLSLQKSRRIISGGTLLKGRKLLKLGDFDFTGLWLNEEHVRKIFLGSSAELVFKKGASESRLGGASEKSLSEEERKRKFFFELYTELIVYGRTEPDAKVWLKDKNIPLRNDGTFNLRFALPEGIIPLDFRADSQNGIDKRAISTSVERTKTKYENQ